LTQYRGRLQFAPQSIAARAPGSRPRAPCGARRRCGTSSS